MDWIWFDETTNMTPAQWQAAEELARKRDKERKLHNDLAEDPAGLCPARCDTERYYAHDYVKDGDGPPVCAYCGRVED